MTQYIKLCILSNDYPSKGRPVYVFVEQLVNAMIDMGEDVSVVAPQSLIRCLFRGIPILPKKEKHVTANNHEYVVYRPYSLTFGNGRKWLYDLAQKFNSNRLSSCLNTIEPTILYAHFWDNAIKLKDFALHNRIPLFVACGEGDNALEELMSTISQKDKNELVASIRGVISVSTENKRKCIYYGLAKDENIIVLPNAVDTVLFHPMAKNLELRKRLGVRPEDFLILFVGSFIPRKGSGVLAKAIQLVHDEHIKVIFAGAPMVGDEDSPECDGIVYKGTIPHNMLPAYHAASDCFVLPTQKEGCCNAIVEALSMGVPVISSDGSFNDDILNENNSIRINPLDVEAIALAIRKMKDDKSFYQKVQTYLLSQKPNSITNRARSIMDFIRLKNECVRTLSIRCKFQ